MLLARVRVHSRCRTERTTSGTTARTTAGTTIVSSGYDRTIAGINTSRNPFDLNLASWPRILSSLLLDTDRLPKRFPGRLHSTVYLLLTLKTASERYNWSLTSLQHAMQSTEDGRRIVRFL